MHQVELQAVAQLHPRGKHVGVHVLHPGDELAEVTRAARLAQAVHMHALDLVTSEVPENAVVGGIPAKVIRMREVPRTLRWR